MIKQERYAKFEEDMENAGFEVIRYNGRFFYEGPSVQVEYDELQTVIRATDVKVQWDQLGKTGLVIYPV